MMQNISFEYPPAWIMLCVVCAIVFSLLLYFRSAIATDKGTGLSFLLAGLRFLSIGIITLLLLGLLLQSSEEESKQPIVVIAQDISESVTELAGNDELQTSINTLTTQLHERFKVDHLYFGSEVYQNLDSTGQTDKTTDINQPIEYISDIYEGENLATAIVITDGIYNEGKNPIYSGYNHTSPIYSVALGDTTPIVDLSVKEVLYNQIGYLNDQTEIQIDIDAHDCNNQRTILRVNQRVGSGTKLIHEENIRIDSDNFFTTRSVTLDLSTAGLAEYVVSVSSLNSEQNKANNRKTIYIDVLDARQNILILANSPHPDVATLKQILSSNKNYELSVSYSTADANINDADLVILHNLPSKNQSIKSTLQRLDQLKTPRMVILGNQTVLSSLNNLQSIVSIKGQTGVSNDSEAVVTSDFTNFNISEEVVARVKRYPPLTSPFGEYSFGQSQQTLLQQAIGGIETDFPLLSFSEYDGIRWAFLFGEGIWRWKYFDYIEDGGYEVISEIIDKSIVYTSTKDDKRKFRVSTSDNIYQENDEVRIVGELYNSNYELINDPEAYLTITNESGEEFSYTFSKSNNGYALNAGVFVPGRYSYKANTSHAGEQYEDTGKFSVRRIEVEKSNLQANHNVLHALATKSSGKVYYPDQINLLQEELLGNDQMKPILYQNIVNRSILDLKWLLGLLLLSLVLEWFLRRYFGRL